MRQMRFTGWLMAYALEPGARVRCFSGRVAGVVAAVYEGHASGRLVLAVARDGGGVAMPFADECEPVETVVEAARGAFADVEPSRMAA